MTAPEPATSTDPTPGGVDVSVLIPVLNEEQHLRSAAEAMLAQELSGTAEFLFIDGGSADRSVEILAELAASDRRVRVLHNPARRTPQALNLGLAAARGEFVARMDAHTMYPVTYLQSGIARLRQGGAEWVSGPQLAVGTDAGSRRVARALGAAFGKGGARFRDELASEREVDSGFTGVWRRETLRQHGGWDEEWLNDQDLELAARIRSAGGTIVCIPEMAAAYVPRSTLRALSRQYMTYGTYRVKTAGRHPQTLRRSQILPPVVVFAAAASVAAPSAAVRRLGRLGVASYIMALSVAAVRDARQGPVVETLTLPAVWLTMHASYGIGFVRGCRRFGVPLRALGGLAGVGRRQTSGG